ncbi:Membrane-bound lytic murein transglycosylase D precursor [Enhygromyxa salina]|uniref:Membrane-bound lytic murein transglycosylase D n=1 Tax=Enhygromyxa salina TaxID=215803 RepID=A0A0C2CX11_9BACT|nr:penicillin-insensitive murein endopeptidase [Enhygromyxa salina]KIG14160.1 Membrane-bound lytic murein transglycosylase D precursor [Enhygromyxa salina]
MGLRVELLGLSAALVACEAIAATPNEPDPTRLAYEIEDAPTPEKLEQAAPAIAQVPVDSASDDVTSFAPSWRMPAPTSGQLPRWIQHPTVARETIEQLALRYGVQAQSIREWNNMTAEEQPHPWRPQPLRIRARRAPPPRQALDHAVAPGDTWGSIARRYGVDYRNLRAWNVSELGRELDPDEHVKIWVDPVVFNAIVHDKPANDRAAQVRPGAHGVGTPQAGSLIAGVQIPPGEGYELRFPKSAYGTTFAVRQTVAALDRFVASTAHPHPLSVGTMSRQRGGEIGSHLSHQTGRDLDIRLPLRAEVPQALNPTPRRVAWSVTWELVHAFAQTKSVQVIFLDYDSQRRLYKAAKATGASEQQLDAMLQFPRGSGASLGLIRHSPGHEGHIHVRFSCGPAEPECGSL